MKCLLAFTLVIVGGTSFAQDKKFRGDAENIIVEGKVLSTGWEDDQKLWRLLVVHRERLWECLVLSDGLIACYIASSP